MTSPSTRKQQSLVIAVTWSSHRRTTELCDFLQIELFEIIFPRKGIYRYIWSTRQTWHLFFRIRPKVVFIQSPSLVLVLFVNLVKHIFSFRVVMDAHNESVKPYISKSVLVLFLTNLALRASDLLIITNHHLAAQINKDSNKIFILPDRLPRRPVLASRKAKSRFVVSVICTSAPDEPIPAILAAARILKADVDFSISGSRTVFFERFGQDLPSNVVLAGFLPADEYWQWIAYSDVVLDLTEMPDCLVCGAYEAIAIGTPVILSDNNATRNLFGSCAVITKNQPEDIVAAIQSARRDQVALIKRTSEFSTKYEQDWVVKANHLKQLISLIANDRKKRKIFYRKS